MERSSVRVDGFTMQLREWFSESWMDDARCEALYDQAPDGESRADLMALFFNEAGGRVKKAVRAICAMCPVQDECLDYAVKYRIEDGIWGGSSIADRRRIWAMNAAADRGAA